MAHLNMAFLLLMRGSETQALPLIRKAIELDEESSLAKDYLKRIESHTFPSSAILEAYKLIYCDRKLGNSRLTDLHAKLYGFEGLPHFEMLWNAQTSAWKKKAEEKAEEVCQDSSGG